MSLRLSFVSVVLGVSLACSKPPPPPAAATAAIALDGAHQRADHVETHKYMDYTIGGHIEATPDEVWAILIDAGAFPGWNSTVLSLEGDIALGQEIELVSRANEKRTFKLTVSTFEPASKMVWEDGNNAFRGVRTFTLAANEAGTDFTMREAFSGSMMKMIAKKLPDFGDDFDDFFADLKREAEKP